MDVLQIFREEADRLIKEMGIDHRVDNAKEGFGDFTLPCFSLAKKYHKSPAEIAKELESKIEKTSYFERIEAVGPYLNFHISKTKLAELSLNEILSGNIFNFEKKEKVILEHTSANPTGPLHVGRARNPIIGDTMARILREYGYDVEVQYFVNDAGLQVATLIWGLKNLNYDDVKEAKCDHAYVKYYQEASKLSEMREDVRNEIRAIMQAYESGDPNLKKFIREKIGCVLEGILQSLRRLNIYVDTVVWESDLIPFSKKVAEELSQYVDEDNGAYYIDMEKMGVKIQKNRFYLYRSDGTTLYFLRDIAYHLNKSKIARYLIDVLGEDHKLHFEALKAIVGLLNPNVTIRPLFYAFVSLPEGKMSTRRGRAIYLDDLLDEGYRRAMEILKDRDYPENEARKIAEKIAISSIRYSILNVQEEKPIVFRWDQALSFEGESAPFIIYTFARANSILKKASWNGSYFPELITHPQEYKLLKLMAMYPSVLTESAEKLSPYLLARYAYSLAMQFNQFYRDCPVIMAEDNLKESRLAIVNAFKILMERVIVLLGLEPLEKM